MSAKHEKVLTLKHLDTDLSLFGPSKRKKAANLSRGLSLVVIKLYSFSICQGS